MKWTRWTWAALASVALAAPSTAAELELDLNNQWRAVVEGDWKLIERRAGEAARTRVFGGGRRAVRSAVRLPRPGP